MRFVTPVARAIALLSLLLTVSARPAQAQVPMHGSFEWFQELIRLVGFERANEWKTVLREDGGHFRSGPIYLFFFTADGYVIFHGANPWREGRFAEDIVDIMLVLHEESQYEEWGSADAGGGPAHPDP